MSLIKLREKTEYPFKYYLENIKKIEDNKIIIDFVWFCISHCYNLASKQYLDMLYKITKETKNYLKKNQQVNVEELRILANNCNISTLNFKIVPIHYSVVVSYSQLAFAVVLSIENENGKEDREGIYLKSASSVSNIISSDLPYETILDMEIKFIKYLIKKGKFKNE